MTTTTKEEAANGGTHNDAAAAAAAATKDEAARTTTRPPPPPMVPDSRFGGLAGAVEASVASSMERNLGSLTAPFPVTPQELGLLSNERTRVALADLLEKGVKKQGASEGDQEGDAAVGEVDEDDDDIEALPEDHRAFQKNRTQLMRRQVMTLVEKMREAEAQKQAAGADGHGHGGGGGAEDAAQQAEADKHADVAANVLTSVLLRSSPESGIDPREVEHRRAVFGSNGIADKKIDSFLKLCWEAVQDFVLIMLIVLGTISIIVEVTTHEGPCTTCWIEGAAILVSVVIVVCVTAGIDYAKQFAFIRLTRSLNESNTKAVIRDAKQLSVTDEDIVVGDIISVNAHALATIPADCVLLGPPADLKMDESTLTGESKLISKMPGDVILSGTNAVQGSGKMVVIAVGVHSVAGKIRARVYESEDHEGDLEGEEEDSPLFVKLDLIAKRIGMVGTFAAAISLIGSCISGFLIVGENDDPAPVADLVKYIVTAITVLAVAVPEGLPLAVTLALAFSSNKMMRDQNLVKHLDACETMGCATTICTDKTGTLTANKMTARAFYTGKDRNYLPDDPAVSLGEYMTKAHADFAEASPDVVDLICNSISICTMNETVLYYDKAGKVEGSGGNPTEVALLQLVHDLGKSFVQIRNKTRGRSDQGKLGEFLSEGKQFGFSSARKMMSWAVPLENGAYRLYCKGAQEVVFSRCIKQTMPDGSSADLTEEDHAEFREISFTYARRGMRGLALAYRDCPPGFNLEALSETIKNSDGTAAFEAETELVIIGLVGIEDPLRHEVPGAIEKCYQAGIDVRLVTGDNSNTAVSIAYQAGILRDFHFLDGTTERVAQNLKENVLMEGKTFREKVYHESTEEKDGVPQKEFDQAAFDKIWPHLRVLARSSPDDKLTLAHGLNQSNLFADKAFCKKILDEEGIYIFPDRQVIAMTGDGTNDAPALKRADIGFAMGVAGTQIAKDAADIILLDDNFASIVTAAKWGRNVYASIQKFLQFQLTVNLAAVVTALVGSFAFQRSPLAAIQLLWVNLLMDSLASLALASEPPVDELLQKPPVNRTDSMITKHMAANMVGHACYQITVVMVLLFKGPDIFGFPPGDEVEDDLDENSVHYTLIFNTFVFMTLFNEINARKLKGEFNVFKGITNNPLFLGILITTAGMQCLIVQYGSVAFKVAQGGLDGKYWGVSLLLGFGSLPVQQIINVLYRIGQYYKGKLRNHRRKAKQAHMTTERL